MKNRFIMIVLAFLFISCDNWLNVKPEDNILEENIFNSADGFRTALNGIYVEMNAGELYGRSLTCELVEVLANRYAVNFGYTDLYPIYTHTYNKEYGIKRFDDMWALAYSLIGNINLIVKNCDAKKDLLSGIQYNMIKGEALALRAFLHFDMFRLFGPVYASDTTAVSLPYNQKFSYHAENFLPANQFLQIAISDLKSAIQLLEVDPIIEKGPNWSEDVYDLYRDRTTRMNYYATQLLLARVALYAKDKTLALSAAKKVMEAQEKWYPFTSIEAVSGKNNPDRIFASEIVFALENNQREEIFNSFFDAENLLPRYLLAFRQNKLNYIYDKEINKDCRFKALFAEKIHKASGIDYRIFTKYDNIANARSNKLLPLLRICEAYYIAAECEPDPVEGMKHLNLIRNKRGLETETNASLLPDLLLTEYLREFVGEGQLFFYYKRLNKDKILDGNSNEDGQTRPMNAKAYVIPLPVSEIQYR